MNVHDLRRKAEKLKDTLVRIYNPDTNDFSVFYDDGSGRKEYTIRALEMEEFPYHIANHIKKHLTDHLYNKRGIKSDSNPQDTKKKISEEIEVKLE